VERYEGKAENLEDLREMTAELKAAGLSSKVTEALEKLIERSSD
jgi:hypothetical protein